MGLGTYRLAHDALRGSHLGGRASLVLGVSELSKLSSTGASSEAAATGARVFARGLNLVSFGRSQSRRAQFGI
jgi:hypothetical protein